jgi:hypothetical protein
LPPTANRRLLYSFYCSLQACSLDDAGTESQSNVQNVQPVLTVLQLKIRRPIRFRRETEGKVPGEAGDGAIRGQSWGHDGASRFGPSHVVVLRPKTTKLYVREDREHSALQFATNRVTLA